MSHPQPGPFNDSPGSPDRSGVSNGVKVLLIVGAVISVIVVAVIAAAFIQGAEQAGSKADNMPNVTSAKVTVMCLNCSIGIYGGTSPNYMRAQFGAYISNSRWLTGNNLTDLEFVAGNNTGTYLLTRINIDQPWSIGWNVFLMQANATSYGGTLTVEVVLNIGITVFDHSITFTSSDLGSSKQDRGSWTT